MIRSCVYKNLGGGAGTCCYTFLGEPKDSPCLSRPEPLGPCRSYRRRPSRYARSVDAPKLGLHGAAVANHRQAGWRHRWRGGRAWKARGRLAPRTDRQLRHQAGQLRSISDRLLPPPTHRTLNRRVRGHKAFRAMSRYWHRTNRRAPALEPIRTSSVIAVRQQPNPSLPAVGLGSRKVCRNGTS